MLTINGNRTLHQELDPSHHSSSSSCRHGRETLHNFTAALPIVHCRSLILKPDNSVSWDHVGVGEFVTLRYFPQDEVGNQLIFDSPDSSGQAVASKLGSALEGARTEPADVPIQWRVNTTIVEPPLTDTSHKRTPNFGHDNFSTKALYF